MLRFNSAPPTGYENLEFSALVSEEILERVDDEEHRKQLGKTIGGLVMANLDRSTGSIGTTIDLVNGLIARTEGLSDWTNRLPFLQGAVEGAMSEFDAQGRHRSNLHE